MNTFYDLPTDLQEYIHGFNPYHRTKLEKVHEDLFADFHYHYLSFVHKELVMSQTYICAYEDCKKAGMGWIHRDYRKALRRLGF